MNIYDSLLVFERAVLELHIPRRARWSIPAFAGGIGVEVVACDLGIPWESVCIGVSVSTG